MHANQMLIILVLVYTSALHTVNSNNFVPLMSADEAGKRIMILGSLEPYVPSSTTINGTVTINTVKDVELLYCNTYSNDKIQHQTDAQNRSGNNVTFIITLPANAAVLDTLLGSAGLRCSTYIDSHLHHFRMFYGSKGVQVVSNTIEKTALKIFKTISEDAPHILWVTATIVSLAFFITIAIPTCMYVRHRSRRK